MNAFVNKLKKIAVVVARERPTLHFFGLVHRVDAPDRWDLLVSSDQLAPWSMEALNYLADLLKKELTSQELVRIARIVALPQENDVVTSLIQNPQLRSGELSTLPPRDRFDKAVVIWPPDGARQMLPQTSRRRVS